jgi:AAA family ATP:ADP antiporter
MKNNGPLSRITKAISKIEPHEIKATLISFSLVLILMAAYYTLRPVRDAMASDWSDAEVSTLWTINFFFSFAVIAAYGFVASKISLKNLIPGVYVFFAISFVIFYLLSGYILNTNLVDKAFYIWVSVFSLFPISFFWSFMSDIFDKNQSKRLFGVITTGASIGAMIGPSIPLLFSQIGTYNLMLIASGMLFATLPIIYYLQNIKGELCPSLVNQADLTSAPKLGGSSFAGFKLFFTNPFLLAIGLFLFLYTGIGSFVYFELKNLLASYPREQRTEIWAFIDLATNALTILTGLFLTSRLTTRFGLGVSLAIIPFIVLTGLISLAIFPILASVVGLQILRRSGNYAITRPAREMLFTYVDQETRFKAKQVIDIAVYRGGDVFWAWAFTLLTTVFGFGMVAIALIGSGIAMLWGVLGVYLGQQTKKEEKTNDEST